MQARARILQSRARRRCAGAEGFTLVELMVAMTGGLFLSIVVFALSRDASRFYQRENRIANATLAGVSGFDRLAADLARAGHLSTPNIQNDPHLCNVPQATWPVQLRTLRALVIETDQTLLTGTETAGAGITPQGVVISGALSLPDELITSSMARGGNGAWQLGLNLRTPAAARIGLSPALGAAGTNKTILDQFFMSSATTGRIVRVHSKGKDQYGIVASTTTAPGEAYVNLLPAPDLVRFGAGGSQCGIDDLGGKAALSVVDVVRYNMRPMVNNNAYKALFTASGLGTGGGPGALPYEGGRVELTRVELDTAGQELVNTLEIVGEYAVDLQFQPWGATNGLDPTIIAVNAPVDNAYMSTQLLRGIHLRFSTRSREADRDADVMGVPGTARYRIPLGAGGTAPYARVRTFQADIPLRNLENDNW